MTDACEFDRHQEGEATGSLRDVIVEIVADAIPVSLSPDAASAAIGGWAGDVAPATESKNNNPDLNQPTQKAIDMIDAFNAPLLAGRVL